FRDFRVGQERPPGERLWPLERCRTPADPDALEVGLAVRGRTRCLARDRDDCRAENRERESPGSPRRQETSDHLDLPAASVYTRSPSEYLKTGSYDAGIFSRT